MIGAVYKKKVRCAHHELGCAVDMEIGHENRNILAHRATCTYEPISCEKCEGKVARAQLADHHANQCPARQSSCGSEDASLSFAPHATDGQSQSLCSSSLYAAAGLVNCVHCGLRVPTRDLKHHQTAVQDNVSGDWLPCSGAVFCETRCRDATGSGHGATAER
jgi:hypothetical protein